MTENGTKQIEKDFEKIIEKYQSKYLLNAMFFIAKNEDIIFSHQIGYANIAKKMPFSPSMQVPIASISKQMTAAAILLLRDEKKLKLDQPIVDYLPLENPVWQGRLPTWANLVSVHHLLTHTSGIPSCTHEFIPDVDSKQDDEIIPYIISYLKDKPLLFQPGEKFDYNNTGYLLLCVIIEQLSQQTCSEFLATRIFKPLAMSNTFLPTLNKERVYINHINQDPNGFMRYVANLEKPHSKPHAITELDLKLPLAGAASIFSCIDDLLKWNQGLFQGKLLSANSLDLMTQIHIKSKDPFFAYVQYGYGFFIKDKGHHVTCYSHGGWLEGVRTDMSYFMKNQTSVIFLSNLSPDEKQDNEAQKRQVHSLRPVLDWLHHVAMMI